MVGRMLSFGIMREIGRFMNVGGNFTLKIRSSW